MHSGNFFAFFKPGRSIVIDIFEKIVFCNILSDNAAEKIMPERHPAA